MDFNKLTLKSQEAVAAAQELARRMGNPELTPDHLTVALARAGAPANARRSRGPCVGRVARRGGGATAEPAVRLGRGSGAAASLGALSRACSTRRSTRCASLGDEYVSVEHLLLALDVVPREALLGALEGVRGGQKVTSQDPEGTFQALEKYGRDLTALAESGKLDPVIGRDEEIRRVIQVLSRRTKNNPVLIGEPGVGKTAIVEGLAQRIVAGRRPRGSQGQARMGARRRRAARRREVPRRVRGAAQGRSRGDPERGRRDRPLHRRAAHDRRGGCGRGRGRSGGPAEADARARRAARCRRDDARRVPQAHREGRRPRAALPARFRRRAVGRGNDRDPARAQGALRGAPRRRDPGLRSRRRRRSLGPVRKRPLSPRQGDRPRGRGRLAPADGDRLVARRARRGRAARPSARDRARRDGQRAGDRARAARARARGREGRPRRARRALVAREGIAPAGRRDQAPARRAAHGGRARGARREPRARGRDPIWPASRVRKRAGGARAADGSADGEGGGRRGRHRGRRRLVDRDSRLAPARGRGREAHPHGGAAAPARRRPGRGRRGRVQRAPARALGAAGPEPADRLVHLLRARQESERPSSPARSRSSCSTTSARSCAWTCPSTRSGTPSRGSSVLRRVMSATRKAASSRRPYDAARTPCSCSTRSRRRTTRSSTCSSSCSTTAA